MNSLYYSGFFMWVTKKLLSMQRKIHDLKNPCERIFKYSKQNYYFTSYFTGFCTSSVAVLFQNCCTLYTHIWPN
jgi:hypothetical protein